MGSTMRTHPKKRVDIIVEPALLDDTLDLATAAGAKGYTVVPCIAELGANGRWRSGDISSAAGRVMVTIIADADVAGAIVDRAFETLSRYAAIITVADVEVVRGDRF